MGLVGIDDAVARLRVGGLVAFPTETVYGLGGDARDRDAVARVYAIKGRAAENPLIVHVSSVEMARACVCEWPDSAGALVRAFWPGALTIVLGRDESIPAIVAGGGATVAVRMPRHPVAIELIERFGGPIVGPSANRSGFVSPTTAEHVLEQFDGDDVVVLDGGACRTGIESTVLRLADGGARVLRAGVIGGDAIAAVLGIELGHGDVQKPGQVESPGLLGRHYSPKTPARLVDDAGDSPAGAVVLAISLWAGERVISMPSEAGGYARRLYAALREADAFGGSEIVIERPPTSGATPEATAIWVAIHDRLGRATG